MSAEFPLGKIFYVMRHAETNDNLKGIASGSNREPELTENGRHQAVLCGDTIEKLENKITQVITSEMKRTRETGQIVFDRDSLRNIPHIIDKGVNERAYGIMEGLPEKRRREFKKISGIVDGEESKEEVRDRVVAAVKRNLGDGKTPLFITHGGTILRLIGVALGGEKVVDELKKKERLAKNCALYEFVTPKEKGGKWQVNLLTLGENKVINREPVEVKKNHIKTRINGQNGIGL